MSICGKKGRKEGVRERGRKGRREGRRKKGKKKKEQRSVTTVEML